MNMRSGVTERVRSALESEPSVVLVYVFGSAARGELGPISDVDVAVVVDRDPPLAELGRLAGILEAAAGRRVDLVLLDEAPPLFAQRAVSGGVLAVCRDDRRRVRLETDVLHRYEDTRLIREAQGRALRRRLREREFGR